MNIEIGKNYNAAANQIVRRIFFPACSIALVLALMISQPARADRSTPPDLLAVTR